MIMIISLFTLLFALLALLPLWLGTIEAGELRDMGVAFEA